MNRFTQKIHSELYLKYRVSTPDIVVQNILNYFSREVEDNLLKNLWNLALDVGCGSGQSTRVWAKYFEKVIGVDVSQTQMSEATNFKNNPTNVSYSVSQAESLKIPDNSVNLLIVSQAIHWFDKTKFYSEAQRVLSNNGVIAIYRFISVDPIYKNKIILHNSIDDLHPSLLNFMPRHVREEQRENLKNLKLPFEKRKRIEDISYEFESDIENFIGFLKSRSAYVQMERERKDLSEKYLNDLVEEMIKNTNVGSTDELFKLKILIRYKFVIELGRKV